LRVFVLDRAGSDSPAFPLLVSINDMLAEAWTNLMGDVLLTVAVCSTQLALGYMGVHVSLKPPQSQHHKYWIAAFILVGAIGIFLTAWLAERAGEAQSQANSEIHEANAAATSANSAATEAAKAAVAAIQQTKDAQETLSTLINKRSKETTQALIRLNTTTESSVKGISRPRRIPDDKRAKLLADLSAHKGTIVSISYVNGDGEGSQFANDWYRLLSDAGWTIKSGLDSVASGGAPPVGVLITLKGKPVAYDEAFDIPADHPAAGLTRAMLALTPSVRGQRREDLADNEVMLTFGVLPRSP
jgi:hypothetical protein